MASLVPDFDCFHWALALRGAGLSSEVRRELARGLFVSLYVEHPPAEEPGGIVLWDELDGTPRNLGR
ncbi:MAG: hypothetical protein AB7P52_13360 [Alphaproteobacteria bacterium]